MAIEQRNRSPLQSLVRTSTIEGIFAQIYFALGVVGSSFLTRFAILLNASPFHFSLLAAIGQFSQIFQPVGIYLTRNLRYRKKMVFLLNIWGRPLTFLFGVLPLLFVSKLTALWLFLALCLLSSSLQSIGGNIWIAWISDMVPLRIRGRFFSGRNQYLLFAGLITSYFFSIFIDLFDNNPHASIKKYFSFLQDSGIFITNNLPYAFLILFAFATVVGILGLFILLKQPEKHKAIETEQFSTLLIQPLRDKNFRRLIYFGFWWMLSCGIGAQFWGYFMMKKLCMSLFEVQIYNTCQTIATIASLRYWGIFIDRFGNKPMMRIAIMMGSINPLIWVFVNNHSYWILYIEGLLSGVMWAGAGVVATNFVLSISPKGQQQAYSGLYGAFAGIGMMATMLISGKFLPHPMQIGNLHLEPEQVLFALTGFARLTAEIPLTWVKEPNARSLRVALSYLNQQMQMKIVNLSSWMFRRN